MHAIIRWEDNLLIKANCHLEAFRILFFFYCILVITWITGCSLRESTIPTESISSNNKVTLSWEEIPGATSYNVYLSTKPKLSKYNSTRIQNADNPITITDLEPGTTYYFIVTAVDDFGEGQNSKEIAYQVEETQGFVKIENLLAPGDQIIFFDSNSTKLLKSEIEKLNRFAKYILEFKKYQLNLKGYTDSYGDANKNRLISEYRAEAVKLYLLSKGVKADNINIAGYGASNYISDNDTAEGRRRNRRVEINFSISE